MDSQTWRVSKGRMEEGVGGVVSHSCCGGFLLVLFWGGGVGLVVLLLLVVKGLWIMLLLSFRGR